MTFLGKKYTNMVEREQLLRHQAYKLVLWQGVIAMTAAVVAFFAFTPESSFSLLLGALTAMAANFYFARKLFSIKGRSVAKKFAKAFVKAELFKILITIALTLLAIKLLKAAFLPFIVGYALCYFVFWFSPLIVQARKVIEL